MEKTETKTETLNRLFKENGLLPEDVHKHNHYTIITRMGIEKIQAKNKVTAHYEAIVMERDFAVIKGTFSKEGVPDLETFGSASKETSQNKYYAEMAEKRCLSRGVLKICKFYELGVYGEDEADDFKAPQQAKPVNTVEAKSTQENAPHVLVAIKELLASKSREESGVIWNQYPQFHQEKSFIEAGKAVAAMYPKAEASHAS
jgi:hypothetical protein